MLRFSDLQSRLIPPEFHKAPEKLQRATALMLFSFGLPSGAPAAAKLITDVHGPRILVWSSLLTALGGMSSIFILKWTRSFQLAASVFLVMFFINLSMLFICLGGLSSPFMPMIACSPIISVLLLGSRWGTVASLPYIGLAVACYFLDKLGKIPSFAFAFGAREELAVATLVVIIVCSLFMLVSMDRVQQLLLRMNKEKEQQLVTSAKMAALGTMAGGVAHEINTPLATIGLSSAQLKRLLSQNPVNEALVTDASQRIQSNVTKIAQIIGSLRTISGDAAGAPLQEHPVKALIQQTLDLCTEKFHHAGIELRLTSIQEGLVIRSRAPEIEQVLLNLLNNAFDAIGSASEKWVEITATGKTDSVEIAVIDSGLGIPPSIQEQLFQPFSTTKDIGKGVGLGLSVSKSVIEGHGGTLTYDAGAPHTRFVIRLPV